MLFFFLSFLFYFNVTLLQILLEIHIMHSIKLTFQSLHVCHSTFVLPEKNGKKTHLQFVLCFLYTHWIKVNLSMAFPLNRSSPPAVPLEATDFGGHPHHSLKSIFCAFLFRVLLLGGVWGGRFCHRCFQYPSLSTSCCFS